MNRETVQFNSRTRSVTVGDRSIALQEKSWQVISLLSARAPEIVSRADIIDEIWRGNFLTVEKGLNQAIWSIRAALGDDTKDTRFVRTIPRVGYQWIHVDCTENDKIRSTSARQFLAKAAGVAVLLVIPSLAAYTLKSTPDIGVEPPTQEPGRVATKAYRVGRDIHVEFASGCLGILKNGNNMEIGEPVLSANGTRVAVAMRKQNSCRLVTIDVTNGKRQDFGACPSEVI